MEKTLTDYREELLEFVHERYVEDGRITTNVPSLNFFVSTATTEFVNVMYKPCICISLQGSKTVGLNDIMLEYNESKHLLSSIHIPAKVRISRASKEEPFISLSLTFTMEEIFDTLKDIKVAQIETNNQSKVGMCLCDNDNPELLEAVLRLAKLNGEPQKVKFLSSLIIKEILYILISNKGGEFLKEYVMEGSSTGQVVRAIMKIKKNYNENISMSTLAKSLGLSESSMYHIFKKLTTMSPLQFQKTLRLEEAKQMLLMQNREVSDVAFEVGYESPSQFSREYSRMFGLPPKSHIKQLRENI
ncbi:MAG: AraC family transcriptional regulator [Campylobacteraceae bacterium]